MLTHTAPARLAAAELLNTEVVAIDGETFYSSDYSVSDSSYWHYTHDSRFRCYLATFVGPGLRVACDPADFDWWSIDGKIWVSHNRPFEKAWYDRLCELGKIEQRDGRFPQPLYWGDTMPLVVYLRCPAALAGAVKILYGITRSKEIRNVAMKGKTWEQYGPELQEKIKAYALDDADDCRRIWVDHWQKWPDHERWIADMLAERGERGFAVDQTVLDEDITFMKRAIFEAKRRIPWADDKPVLSRPALNAECAKHGITPPKSMSLSDEECAEWEEEHGDKFDWIAAIRSFRRANTILSKLQALKDRIRDDGRMQFQLNYHAAHTGRSGGRGGYNMLNQSRAPFYINSKYDVLHRKEDLAAVDKHLKEFKRLPDHILRGVDFRSKLVASPGHKLVIGDLAQIEARVLRWLAGDRATLKLIEQGFNPYEAHAMRFMNFTGKQMKKTDPAGYLLAKARELALGFLVGWHKFLTMARMYVGDEYFARIFGAEVTNQQIENFLGYIDSLRNKTTAASYLLLWKRADEFTRRTYVNSWLQVTDFRDQNPEIMAFAKRMREQLEAAIGDKLEIELPSGRVLTYFDVTKIDDGIQARVERGGPFSYFHAGLLLENCLGADTEVMTPRGWVPITSVTIDDKVWDGNDWVRHEGVVAKGVQPVIDCHGVTATPDHLFLVNGEWTPAEIACELPSITDYLSSYEQATIRSSPSQARKLRESTEGFSTSFTQAGVGREEDPVGGALRLRPDSDHGVGCHKIQQDLLQAVPDCPQEFVGETEDARDVETSGTRGLALHETTVHGPESSGVSQLRRSRNSGVPGVGERLRSILAGHGSDLEARTGFGPSEQRWELRSAELPLDDSSREFTQPAGVAAAVDSGCCGKERCETQHAVLSAEAGRQTRDRMLGSSRRVAPVYDIKNAGPSHRFAVRTRDGGVAIAHNCTQAFARDVFCWKQIRAEEIGLNVLLDVYDELVCDEPMERNPDDLLAILRERPSYAKTLPLDGEVVESPFYCK